MTTFLLLLSFLLHIIAMAIIYRLFKTIQTIKAQSPENIVELLEVYLEEIKEENDRLKNQLNSRTKKASPNDQKQYTDDQIDHSRDPSHDQVIEPDINDSYEQSFQAQVLYLYDTGHSIDAIAKELNCGKTEAELAVKIHKT